ncbi:MFS transporter [Burkholderia humptydooensis]|uniref:MFS transporter n=2 Tax=Burkholderia humptydooensis TaxID=430531 RepID=A0A7U4P8A6_9BURK|nr:MULTISPECIES: MFS transporter [Burkholderia]AJY38849.1 major Facilitator Superfamily protein [Burkholderia sp. 2002721687]ALX44797.1 transporter [Burkholderia humptydooensis]EIP86408.1 Major facilitator superfamily (MFS_1) transporter [Burkholderia humptydooensis MSMB43]QPS46246.1 MFS transporter [Burkholderia humptydooensis]
MPPDTDTLRASPGEFDAGYAASQTTFDAPTLSRAVALLFALACGLAVANVYYSQPLLDTMAHEFGISPATIGLVVTVTQIGYGFGLLLIVPLGDLLNRRRLIVGQSLLSVLALVAVGVAPTSAILLIGMAAVGLLAVVTQVLVAYAAFLARPSEQGQIVGVVTSGIIIGILLARTVSGTLSDLFGWRSVYFVSAAATLAIAALLYRALPDRHEARSHVPYPRLIGSVFTLFVEEPVLRVRATIALLVFSAITVLWTPMVLPLSAPPFSLSHTQVGLFGLAGAVGALGAARAGRLADRGFAQRTTGYALLLMLVSWLPVALLDRSLWALVVGVVTIDFALQSVHVANQSLIYRVRPDARSRLTAGYMICYSIGCASGSIGSTLVYARYGWLGVCTAGALISAAALVFWAATRHLTPETRPEAG